MKKRKRGSGNKITEKKLQKYWNKNEETKEQKWKNSNVKI